MSVTFQPPSIEELNAKLPQFEFLDVLGIGGMGAVFKARQPKLDRFVAVKVLPPITDDELGFADRFEREAQAMAKLSHPHIVGVHDFGETEDGQLFFVMEFIEGADLHQLIGGGQLTLDHFFGWIPQICDALEYAHRNGIVHRDIKPANILINAEGQVKMADFGLAKLTQPGEAVTALTRADLSMGTPDYAAPEQIKSTADVDYRADIYSLGVVMYQLLTGHLPRGAFKMPSEENHDLDPQLDAVVLKAMQSAPDDRYQSATEISTSLTGILSAPASENEASPALAKTDFPWGRLIGAGVMALVLVGTVIAALLVAQSRKNEDDESEKVAEATEQPTPPEPVVTPENVPTAEEKRRSEMNAFRNKLGARAGGKGPAKKSNVRFAKNLVALSRGGKPLPADHPLIQFPSDLRPVKQVVIGQAPPQFDSKTAPFVVALQVDGAVDVWGANRQGLTEIPEQLGDVVMVAAGLNHVLALRQDGTISAWGGNRVNQTAVPPEIQGKVVSVAAGHLFSAALLRDGTLQIWGDFPGTSPPENLPKITAIAAGFDHLLALDADGNGHAWGNEQTGQTRIPDVFAGRKTTKIVATQAFSAALLDDGQLVSWGPAAQAQNGKFKGIVTDILGSGDLLAIKRDTTDRWEIFGPGSKNLALPSGMRAGAPQEIRFAAAPDLVLLYKVAPAGADVPNFSESIPEEPEPAFVLDPETEAGKRIIRLQGQFENAYLDQVTREFDTQLAKMQTSYRGAIGREQLLAAESADLDTAKALKSESERIAEAVTMPETDPPDLPEKLRTMRDTYRTAAAKIESDREAADADLLQKYETALADIRDDLTRANQLDQAEMVQQFIDSRE